MIRALKRISVGLVFILVIFSVILGVCALLVTHPFLCLGIFLGSFILVFAHAIGEDFFP